MHKISIITVSYNSAKTIRGAIESVLNQTYKDIEYIIIDGGSIDGTIQLVKSYGDKISRFISERDSGMYDALNKGIRLAKGEVIGLLHSDDIFYDNKVVEDISFTFENNSIDACYGNITYVKEDNTDLVVRNWVSSDFSKIKMFFGWHPPHTSLFIKKNIYERFGDFNLKYKIASDYEYMLRIFYKYGIKAKYINRFITKMRIGGMSNRNISNILKANIECIQSWKDTLGYYNPFILFKPIPKIIQYLNY